jgi:MtN3 and saliva related transmembrane protein
MDKKITVDIFGYAATTIGTIVFLPQVIQIWRTKKADDVSLLSFIMIFVACILWITYGVMILAYPIIIVNSVILVLSSIIIVMKLKFK